MDVPRFFQPGEHVAELFESHPTPMWVVDRTTLRFLDVNDAAVAQYGWTRDEFLAMTATDIRPPEDAPAVAELIRGSPMGFVSAGRWRHRRKDGSLIDVEIDAHGIAVGAVDAYLAVARDGTARRRSARELRENEALLHRLTARLLTLQDEERRRLARELHDTTAQSLAAVAMNLETVRRLGSALDAPALCALEDAAGLVEECSREVRTLSYLLHPPLLDEVGLGSALRWYVDGYARRSGIEVSLDLPEDLGRLPTDVETALFRIVQECLTNVHRHSGGGEARIRLRAGPVDVVLEVQDDGGGIRDRDGMRPELPASVGVGIAGLRERVRQRGGAPDIVSGAGGTTVAARLPRGAAPA